jgi:hypothetical protein
MRQIVFDLTLWDGNTFAARCQEFSPTYDGRVVFSSGPEDSIQQMTTTLLADESEHATYVRAA